MQEIAIRGKLVAKNIDSSNYITYVFENLESDKYENKKQTKNCSKNF